MGFTLIYEENYLGGIEIWVFLGFGRCSHVGLGGGGSICVSFVCFRGMFCVNGVSL
jgi:hypothetical protein